MDRKPRLSSPRDRGLTVEDRSHAQRAWRNRVPSIVSECSINVLVAGQSHLTCR